jgi:hypothetical protein
VNIAIINKGVISGVIPQANHLGIFATTFFRPLQTTKLGGYLEDI